MNTLYDLYINLKQTEFNIESYLNSLNYNKRGKTYEKVFMIYILSDCYEHYKLLDDNYEIITDKQKYLHNNKIDNGCASGRVDIKILNTLTNEKILVSSKYYKQERSMDKYDIQKIYTYASNHNIQNYKIGLLIHNKHEFITKYNKSKTDNKLDITNIINNNLIFDLTDLINMQQKFIKTEYSKLNEIKPSIQLRNDQIEIVNKIKLNKNTILNICPRAGKTYIIGGYIDKCSFDNIIIITPNPSETKHNWFDMFTKYNNFNNYNITQEPTNEKEIVIVSKQYLDCNDNYKKFNKYDLIVFDEQDYTGNTNNSKDIIIHLSKETTQHIYLSGTAYKSQYYNSDYEVITYTYDELIKNNPNKYPNRIYLTPRLNDKYYEFIKSKDGDIKWSSIFQIENSKFTNLLFIKTFINDFISGNNKSNNYRYDTINGRINKLTDMNNKYTQLWFLPENNIKAIEHNLMSILLQDNYYRSYKILCAYESKYELYYNNKDKVHTIIYAQNKCNITEIIKQIETDIRNDSNYNGLVILTGKKLNRGISLPHVNSVFMLNDSSSIEKYIQSSFRCLTEEKGKDKSFIIDFNINRILSLCINYDTELTFENKIEYIINNDLLNIDIDQFTIKEQNIQNLLNIWNKSINNQLDILNKSLTNILSNIDIKILNKFNDIKINISNQKLKSIKEKLIINDQKLTNKQKKELIKNNNELDKRATDKLLLDKLNKEILPYVIIVSSLISYDYETDNLIEQLKWINDNTLRKEIINNQLNIIWNNNNLLNILIDVLVNNKINITNITPFINKIKYNIKLLKDKPIELSDFIDQCLISKYYEVKKYAEVHTPKFLINEILDKLEFYYPNIYKHKYKWLDPCANKGDFFIEIYKRLIKYHSHNEIINEMFYAYEINPRDVFLYKLVFGDNSNIICCDSLKNDKYKNMDIIITNPPYNKPGSLNTGNTIYQDFIKKYIEEFNLCLCFITPPCWRKPNVKLCKFYGIYDLVVNKHSLRYLEIHDVKDGMKVFNAGTRYDWYIIDNSDNKLTDIKDIDGIEIKMNCNNKPFLSNGKYDEYNKVFDFTLVNNCEVLYSRSSYGADRRHVSKTKTNEYKYPLIHTTPQSGITYRYSNCNNKGMFGIKKVIFGIGGINPINDVKGEYGMTQMSIAIKYDNDDEGNKIIKAITSDKFKEFIKYNSWNGGFGFEYLIFTYLKKDFYKYFI